MAHHYREFTPHPALRPLVECYWTIGASPAPGEIASDLVLPDGCMDLLIDLSPGNSGPRGQNAHIVGTMTQAFAVASAEPSLVVGVRFRPGGATPFVPAPSYELTDAAVPLDCFWGSDAEAIGERVARAADHEGRLQVLDAALIERLGNAHAEVDTAVLHASNIVVSTGGRTTVDALSRATGLGRRQLERRFRAIVGVGPKLACSVARFRKVVLTLHREPGIQLSALAYRTGYADQPHMSREFKRFSGVSPGSYRRARGLHEPR